MALKFGTEPFYRQLKAAYDREDAGQIMALMYDEVEQVANMYYYKYRAQLFNRFTQEDKEDAFQEAHLYVHRVMMESFLPNPLNDPSAEGGYSAAYNRSFLYKTVGNSLRQAVKRVMRGNSVAVSRADGGPAAEANGEGLVALPSGNGGQAKRRDIKSLDRPLKADEAATLMDVLVAPEASPEADLIQRERVAEACRRFFSLTNAPELVAAVGFLLLCGNLSDAHRSMTDYAALLNGRRLDEVIHSMETLLGWWKIDPEVLRPLKRRADALRDGVRVGETVLQGLTARTLTNRKNSMVTAMREKRTRDGED